MERGCAKVRVRLRQDGTIGSCSDPVWHLYAADAYPEGKEVTQGMLQFISTLLNRFRREDEDGQTLVEYGLLLALIAIIVIVALLFLGPIVSQIFQNVGDNLQGT